MPAELDPQQEGEVLALTAPDVPSDDPFAPEDPVKREPPGIVEGLPPTRASLRIEDRAKVVKDIIKEYSDDITARQEWNERRIQRTAKYRGWREDKTYPWPGASNAHLPVIMTDVQRTEDTLHNAVLSVRPVMNAKAASPARVESEKGIDMLLDYQIFKENAGEERIAKLISAFVQDGQFVCFTPYVQEKQRVTKLYTVAFPGPGVSWDTYIWDQLRGYYPKAVVLPRGDEKWAYDVAEINQFTGERTTFRVDVVRQGDMVQLLCQHEELTFDGPCLIPKELEDVVVPFRSENLQPRTIANPTGAEHVILVDYPTMDEVKRLRASGFYDLITDEDMTKIEGMQNAGHGTAANDPEGQKRLKDDLEGVQPGHEKDEDGVESCTRLMYFGRADIDGDGFDEDVVYWILEEAKVLVRAKYLTEIYPSNPPRRPLQMAKYLPVNERFYAIGLIELMEACYDIIKETFDQMMDAGHLANMPFYFYRPGSNMRPEKMMLEPGVGLPLSNPAQDVFFPTMQQGMTAFGQNVIALVMQILDQVTLVGALQLGGVPTGKSAALRTSQNMQSLLQQGDARPERVLRRFFYGLADIWRQFHILDKAFLSPGKQFRIQADMELGVNPYMEVTDPKALEGDFDFEFGANILNTNRALAGQALDQILMMVINPALMMMGIVQPQHVYTAVKEKIRALGQDHRKYISPPQGQVDDGRPLMSAEDAIQEAMNGRMPYGRPMEPVDQHLQKLLQFAGSEAIQYISPAGANVLGQYTAQVQQELQRQQQQQQLMQQMAAMQQQMSQGDGKPGPQGQANPPNTGPAGNPPVQGRELLDEALPGAGGSASGSA